MAGLAIITEACIDVKDRACVDVCPVQCIYEFDPVNNVLFSEGRPAAGRSRQTHAESGRDRDLRRQRAVRESRRVHVVHRVLSARRVPRWGDLLGGARARRSVEHQVQLGRPEQGPRPHVLRSAQPRRLRRLDHRHMSSSLARRPSRSYGSSASKRPAASCSSPRRSLRSCGRTRRGRPATTRSGRQHSVRDRVVPCSKRISLMS